MLQVSRKAQIRSDTKSLWWNHFAGLRDLTFYISDVLSKHGIGKSLQFSIASICELKSPVIDVLKHILRVQVHIKP